MAPRPSIFNMFGPSPIKPLTEHMEKTHECTQLLKPFFSEVMDHDFVKAEELYRKIAEVENEADQLKRDLRLHLPKSLFMPVSRTDLLMMLVLQDRIANKAKDIAGLFCGRKMSFPQEITSDYQQLLFRCLDAEAQAHKAIHELDDLLEAGFRGQEVNLVEGMIVELDKIEHDTDELQISIRKKIFMLEKDLNPVDVIFLYKIIEWTGDLADRAQTVGGQLELLLAN